MSCAPCSRSLRAPHTTCPSRTCTFLCATHRAHHAPALSCTPPALSCAPCSRYATPITHLLFLVRPALSICHGFVRFVRTLLSCALLSRCPTHVKGSFASCALRAFVRFVRPSMRPAPCRLCTCQRVCLSRVRSHRVPCSVPALLMSRVRFVRPAPCRLCYCQGFASCALLSKLITRIMCLTHPAMEDDYHSHQIYSSERDLLR